MYNWVCTCILYVGSCLERVGHFKVDYSETQLLLVLCVLSGCKETGLSTELLSFPHKPFSFKDFSL